MPFNKTRTLSPFVPVPDESLHSYILRLSILYGINDFSYVINFNNKSWNGKLRVPQQVGKHVETLKKNYLCRIIKSSLPTRGFFMRINKLVDLCTLLRTQKQLDFGAKDLPINFCKKCFKEQLKTQGFTYFKQDWALHSQCSIHNCQLYTFLPETPKKAISSLKGILALNYDQTVSPFSRTKISKIQSDHPSYLFAPCAEPMASKLMWDLRIFPEGYTELPDYTNYSKGAFSILQRANYLEEIEPRWASEVLKSPPPFLNKFTEHLLSTLELIKDSAAVSDNAPPLEQCYKLKGKKCDKCTLPCPSSKKIESSLIDSPQEFKSVPSSQHCDSWAIDLLHTVNRRNEKTIRTSETQLWVEASRQKGSRVYKNVQEVRKRLFEELSNHKY